MSDTQIINDMFEDMSINMPLDVQVPESVIVKPVTTTPPPAYTVVNKNSLTDTEYAIFNVALEGLENLSSLYSTLDERFANDCNGLRLSLLDVLAQKFGYADATLAKEDGLTFKLKANHEVELLKKSGK